MPRLLLVDDAPEVGLLVERLGRRLGLEVACCTDLAAAWAELHRSRPDLLLLDLNLVAERGETLCRRVRADPELRHLRIALFTHLDCTNDLVGGLEAGADFVVAKDLLRRPEAWQARVAEILADVDRQPAPGSESCTRNCRLATVQPEGLAALDRALRHPLFRALGPEVTRLLLRRAVTRAAGEEEPGRWLQQDGLTLNIAYLSAGVPSETVAVFAAALAEAWQRLLGREASAAVRELLVVLPPEP